MLGISESDMTNNQVTGQTGSMSTVKQFRLGPHIKRAFQIIGRSF